MGIAQRLLNIASAIKGDWKERALNKSRLESELDDWEEKLGIGKENQGTPGAAKKKPISQVEEDLHLFGLKNGAKWAEVKKTYRRESKKYHADLHHNDEEKKKVAHEIMLIYNSAYDRLEKHYRPK